MTTNGKQKDSVLNHDPLAELGEELKAEPEQLEEKAADAGTEPDTASSSDTVEETDDTADGIALGDSLTIAELGELMDRLRAGLDLGGTLTLHAGDVEQVDAAGVQLLCALSRDARKQGMELVWPQVSERLESAVRQLGLSDELGF